MSQLMLRVAVAISGRSFVKLHESKAPTPYLEPKDRNHPYDVTGRSESKLFVLLMLFQCSIPLTIYMSAWSCRGGGGRALRRTALEGGVP